MSVEGRAAVVTGGGRGIGAAVARELASGGASVVLVARTDREIDEVAAELRSRGHQAWAISCDVTEAESVEAMTALAIDHLGQVDILVNNAGVASSAPLARITLDDWNRTFAVNATGTFLCTQAFVPGMVKRSWGRVVNVASVAARYGAKYIAAYAASKHAVLGFTRSVAAEVAEAGVTVNAVCPGYVDTEMTRQTLDNIARKTNITADTALREILKRSGHGRLVEPDEVAHAVISLCDERSGSTNGQAIVMDGGWLLS